MELHQLQKMFFDHLKREKSASENTMNAYMSDLACFFAYMHNSFDDTITASSDTIENFKSFLKDSGKAISSVSRSLSSVRAFYTFLMKNGYVSHNPAKSVKNDRGGEKTFDILSSSEVDRLLTSPDGNDEKSVRDRAMLELLYATGLKVSELISLDVSDFNDTLSFIRCRGSAYGKHERIIPLYPKIRSLLSIYLSDSRPFLVADEHETALFVNIGGTRMTRQGLWKLIKHYASASNIKKDITPKALRHSFAAHLLQNGADVAQLRDVLGHADISTTNTYVEFLKRKNVSCLIALHPHA